LNNYIVGAFTKDTWEAHGKRWLESVSQHKGKADLLVLTTAPLDSTGVKVVQYDGNVLAQLAKMDGVFLYAAPNIRFQAEPVAMFKAAADKFAVVERSGAAQGQQPFTGKLPVYEDFWAAPCDLIDMLNRVVEMSFGVGLKPAYFELNLISYFTEFFPWFRAAQSPTEYMPVFDAHLTEDYYADPRSLKRLTAVGLDKPESKKVGVLGSIVKPGKPLLTTKPKKTTMSDLPSSAKKG
jgi:hypothetical protein